MKNITTSVYCLLFFAFSNSFWGQTVVINEILASNTTINQDEDNSYQDWVELYNNSATAINLSGYGLSDDVKLAYKWIFPNVTLNPGKYILVWCSDKNRTDPTKPLHTNFKISASGNTITLTSPFGITVDSVPPKVLLPNISYGRMPDGAANFAYFNNVTPAAANSTVGFSEALNPPTFSHASGFFTAGFDLTLSTTNPGATILYTLDGSEPNAANIGGTTYSYKNQYPEHMGQITGGFLTRSINTYQYTIPITISDRSTQPNQISTISTTFSFSPTYIPQTPIYKGTVVRAKLIKPGALESTIASKSFYISPLAGKLFSLPVVSLSLDENRLFDYNNGIYVAGKDFDDWRTANPTLEPAGIEGGIANYFRVGPTSDRVANMTYIVNGAEVINQDVAIRIHGASSRDFQCKSFNIYARSDLGDNTLKYPFFADRPYSSYTAFVLRNSGNDFSQTMFRDALNHELMRPLNVTTKGYQPTITFINGEFWGMLNLRDKIDKDYFQRVLNIPTKEIDILENDGVIDEGDDINYRALMAYAGLNSLATQANYDYFTTQIDPESFKDYFISNIFLENSDWPGNNIVYWRKKTTSFQQNAPFGQDGRWRWVAHDTDDTYAISSMNINLNTLFDAMDANSIKVSDPAWSTLLFRNMMSNDGFKLAFINRFADLLNTTFITSRILTQMDKMKKVIAPEMPNQFSRWKAPVDDADWNYFLNAEIDFANQRPALQRNHIRSQFGITSNINALLDVSSPGQGYIKMNTIDVKFGTPGIVTYPYPWTGIYFSNIPLTIKAIANPGFTFSHWSGVSTSSNPEITISSASDFNLTAVFVTETVATSHPIYYWLINGTVANNLPLQTLNNSFKAGTTDGSIQFQSCLTGYPFVTSNLNYGKASMERRNSPTEINYIPEVNNNIPFASSDMKGLEIKEPFQNNGLENTMVFNISSSKYKDIRFSFAAINELTNANAIIVEYAVNTGTPVWISTGIANNAFPLTNGYQLFNVDLSTITAANDNPNFKIRLRFSGTNMTADTGSRITFNNIAVYGTQLSLLATIQNEALEFSVYPNPVSDFVTISGINQSFFVNYKLFSIDGKLIKNNTLENNKINLTDLNKGMYLLQLTSDGKTETKKIIKK